MLYYKISNIKKGIKCSVNPSEANKTAITKTKADYNKAYKNLT